MIADCVYCFRLCRDFSFFRSRGNLLMQNGNTAWDSQACEHEAIPVAGVARKWVAFGVHCGSCLLRTCTRVS